VRLDGGTIKRGPGDNKAAATGTLSEGGRLTVHLLWFTGLLVVMHI